MTKMRVRQISRGPMIAAFAGVGLVAALVAGAVVSRDDGPQTLSAQPAAQVSSIRQGCQQWVSHDSEPGTAGTSSWCADLTGWMTDHMTGTGMGPQMMFGGAQQMQTTCRRWMAESPPAGVEAGTATDWCDSMTSWMSENMGTWSGRGDWDDWMMHGSTVRGPMMGR